MTLFKGKEYEAAVRAYKERKKKEYADKMSAEAMRSSTKNYFGK